VHLFRRQAHDTLAETLIRKAEYDAWLKAREELGLQGNGDTRFVEGEEAKRVRRIASLPAHFLCSPSFPIRSPASTRSPQFRFVPVLASTRSSSLTGSRMLVDAYQSFSHLQATNCAQPSPSSPSTQRPQTSLSTLGPRCRP
jgi:hypothetical protein